uniref:NADH-ubiquinone oxidoreductase chain 2 n=1 Tax=Cicadellidae gen. sp. 1 JCX-2018 TaxID=2306300 RepID=A0A346RNI6_9HEMI|nr:NADH dehydrogenase subunit 2 [Cicadellidae gen. sp. 1 JCX-2018]
MLLFNTTKILFSNTLVIGVTMVISSNNWFMMWCGMEITLMSTIPMMADNSKLLSAESSFKYFIVQSTASTLFILSIIIMLIGVNMMMYKTTIVMSMMMKTGIFPFHNWILSMIEGLTTKMTILMLSLLKIPPLTVMSYTKMNLQLPMILSIIFSSIFILNQNSLKKIMTYSSILNTSMMILSINMNKIWLSYFIIYSTIITLMMFLMSKINITFMNQMIMNQFNMKTKMTMWISFLSLGGFPPLLGFYPKMMILEMLINNKMIILTMIVIISSLIMMFNYSRIVFTSILMNVNSQKYLISKTNQKDYMMFLIWFINLSSLAVSLIMKNF